jgi:hypothetical protein
LESVLARAGNALFRDELKTPMLMAPVDDLRFEAGVVGQLRGRFAAGTTSFESVVVERGITEDIYRPRA